MAYHKFLHPGVNVDMERSVMFESRSVLPHCRSLDIQSFHFLRATLVIPAPSSVIGVDSPTKHTSEGEIEYSETLGTEVRSSR